jgi:hypothetical protein
MYAKPTQAQVTEEMIKTYLEHHFAVDPNDDARTKDERA